MTRAGVVALLALLVIPGTGRGQAPVPADSAAERGLPGVHVAPRGRGTAVATTVLLPAGSAADPVDAPGTAYTLAEVLAAEARRRLPPSTELEVRVERDWTAFTLLAPTGSWRSTLSVLASTLFQEPVSRDALGAVGEEMARRFAFEEGAPVREFQREVYGVLTSTSHPWARPPRGRAATVASLGIGALEAFRRSHWDRGAARVGVVGPVDPVEARATVAAAGLGGRPTPARRGGGGRAWRDGDRLLLERDVTNSWIAVLLPAAPDTPRTLLEALAHRVTEQLNPITPDPGIFVADARVEDTPDGAVLMVEAAVFPESTLQWERRILSLVEGLEAQADPAFFRWQRRRFRSARLLAESPPEAEALRIALDLLREGRVRDLPAEIWGLTAEAVAEAADDLGEPRILILGPDLTDESPWEPRRWGDLAPPWTRPVAPGLDGASRPSYLRR